MIAMQISLWQSGTLETVWNAQAISQIDILASNEATYHALIRGTCAMVQLKPHVGAYRLITDRFAYESIVDINMSWELAWDIQAMATVSNQVLTPSSTPVKDPQQLDDFIVPPTTQMYTIFFARPALHHSNRCRCGSWSIIS